MDSCILKESKQKDPKQKNPNQKIMALYNRKKKGFVLEKRKIYLLSRKEGEEMHKFIQEQLRKEYIKLSKSSQTAPVFFVEKKDGKKHMVQDYHYLNEQTIKNNYSLPLISDILENIGIKKVFTKLNLWQGYNNIQIKKGDEWKVAFMTPEGSFEPMVIFFGLANSLAIFKTMMNKILCDLINTGGVVSFIDDMIVGIEEEEGHDKLVEEVVERLVENNLQVKLEKCK